MHLLLFCLEWRIVFELFLFRLVFRIYKTIREGTVLPSFPSLPSTPLPFRKQWSLHFVRTGLNSKAANSNIGNTYAIHQ